MYVLNDQRREAEHFAYAYKQHGTLYTHTQCNKNYLLRNREHMA